MRVAATCSLLKYFRRIGGHVQGECRMEMCREKCSLLERRTPPIAHGLRADTMERHFQSAYRILHLVFLHMD